MYKENVMRQSSADIDWTDFDVLWEDFAATKIAAMRPGNLTRQARLYLGVDEVCFVNRKINREIVAKRRKLRKSSRKSQRSRAHMLTRQINWFLESSRKR